MSQAPERFSIVPDDYHVPYAGTAEDGRKFFLSDELFTLRRRVRPVVPVEADGSFDEVRVDEVRRAADVPHRAR
ncbi:MAG TPA: hypothetical protein VG497_28980 [Kribbella sp.]|nr:hypothetical protein [Kribbella sp.]